MYLKLKSLIVASALVFSIFSYKVDLTKANSYDVATATGPVRFSFHLSEASSDVSFSTPFNLGHKGQDSYVVVIDTGIEKAHPFFQDRVVLEACFASRCPNGTNQMIGSGAAVPVHWHGTHVAGIAAGYNNTFTGVAPLSKIIAINVFDSTGAAYDADIIKALNWVSSISNQYNIASVNMSLGGSTTFTQTCDNYIPDMTEAIKSLKDKNIATVISSGNSYAFGMSAPACISHAVSVAATYKNSNTITEFSNISTLTDLSAPGAYINSSKLLGSYGPASGTSMSAPFVTGAFSVYRSAFGIKSVDQVVSDFQKYGVTSKDSYTNIQIKKINFVQMFAETTPTTTTTVPISTTTVDFTTTTILQTTTTVAQTTTTTSTVVSTTTIPTPTTSSTTTTIVPSPTTTTIAPPAKLPFIPSPILLEVNGLPKSFIWIKYRDPYMNKSFLSSYELLCNGINSYIIPKEDLYSLHSYKLNVPAKDINYCSLTGITIYGTRTKSTSIKYIYPKNKTTSALTSPSISSTIPKKKIGKK